jgi:hypothetical protein
MGANVLLESPWLWEQFVEFSYLVKGLYGLITFVGLVSRNPPMT